MNFIPIFPLEVVAFPDEKLNLHIFEERYKQLVHDCFQQKKSFGIPVVVNGQLQDYGTTVTITEIFKTYENGEMDIKTTGEAVFHTLEIIKEIPEKMYSGAIVSYPDNQPAETTSALQKVLETLRRFHTILNVKKDFGKPDEQLTSYDIAHHCGMNTLQEYEFLQLMYERQRVEYLKRHFDTILPAMEQAQTLKERAAMNGHFRYLKSGQV